MINSELLIFRNGFLAYDITEKNVEAPKNWKKERFANVIISSHPDTETLSISFRDGEIVLLGEAFDPEERIYSQHEIIEKVKQKIELEGTQFLDYLDVLAGRFVIIVATKNNWRIFHDAIGSRSVFYHTSRKIVASHVELISEPLRLRYIDMFVPFITSRNWFFRDVKYLPGAITPYDEIKQLTPNLLFSSSNNRAERYWPRRDLEVGITPEAACDKLVSHLISLKEYLEYTGRKPLIGLTGGTDSRGIYSTIRELNPIVFSWVRSKLGDQKSSKDTKAAQSVAAHYGHSVDIWPLQSPSLNQVDDSLGAAFRKSTAYYRGIDSGWLRRIFDYDLPYANATFIRGFGGEVLRGFYQGTSGEIRRCNYRQFARAYDLNSGSKFTQNAFQEFIAISQFDEKTVRGRDINDIFYWEHRMGTWGSIAMSEADIGVRSIVGYNSRRLFDVFFALNFSDRSSRTPFYCAIKKLAPEIAQEKTV